MSGYGGGEDDSAWRFRVTDHFTIQPSPHFAMQAVGLYEETKFGGPNSRQKWGSLGARPVYFFNDRFSIAFEAGVDWASRPVLRPFVTYAKWSDDFRGLVGGVPYETALEGFSFGLQAEAWW